MVMPVVSTSLKLLFHVGTPHHVSEAITNIYVRHSIQAYVSHAQIKN